LHAEPPASEADNVREAAALCPAAVIAIQD
jgi:hypothetical protein